VKQNVYFILYHNTKKKFTSSFSLKLHMFIRHLTNTVTDAQLIQAATLELGEGCGGGGQPICFYPLSELNILHTP
jgi:hypothetical protein